MLADCKICSPKAIEVGYRANSHLPAEPNAVCHEAAGTVGQRIFDDQRIFDAVSRELFAEMSALADGQHTFVLADNLLCVLVRPTIAQNLCSLVPSRHLLVHGIWLVWVDSNDFLVIFDRIVGFQDLVGDNHLFCVGCLLAAEKVIEVCIVHDAEVHEMEFAALVDLVFDLCRVVGFQIGLEFVLDNQDLEHLS